MNSCELCNQQFQSEPILTLHQLTQHHPSSPNPEQQLSFGTPPPPPLPPPPRSPLPQSSLPQTLPANSATPPAGSIAKVSQPVAAIKEYLEAAIEIASAEGDTETVRAAARMMQVFVARNLVSAASSMVHPEDVSDEANQRGTLSRSPPLITAPAAVSSELFQQLQDQQNGDGRRSRRGLDPTAKPYTPQTTTISRLTTNASSRATGFVFGDDGWPEPFAPGALVCGKCEMYFLDGRALEVHLEVCEGAEWDGAYDLG